MMKAGDNIKNYCSNCYGRTNHVILFVKRVDGSEDYHASNFYMVIECKGCETVSYRTEYQDYESMYPNEDGNWEPSITISIYPEILQNHRKIDDWYYLPQKIQIAYNESLQAFSAGCNLLTGVGFRAIIEAVCKEQGIKGRDLNIMINNMAKEKLITENEARRLHPIRFIGNDSIHEMVVPSTKALYIVLNIVEHLLENIYIIDKQIKNTLETVINTFKDFQLLLNQQIRKLKVNDTMPLANIMDKYTRRLADKFVEFETELLKQIDSGEYKYLSKGELLPSKDPKKLIQNYIILDTNTKLDFDF